MLMAMTLPFSGCHTVVIHNSAVTKEGPINEFVETSRTARYGFVATESTAVQIDCRNRSWQQLTITESGENVREVVLANAGIGLATSMTLGIGVIACAYASGGGPAPPICLLGLLGFAYGAMTVFTLPITHVSIFGSSNTLTWQCAKSKST